jgi:hypothetical protein
MLLQCGLDLEEETQQRSVVTLIVMILMRSGSELQGLQRACCAIYVRLLTVTLGKGFL